MVATETREFTYEQCLEIMFSHNDGKKLSLKFKISLDAQRLPLSTYAKK